MRQPPPPASHDQTWPATPHDQPRPATPHDQAWAAAPHNQRRPAAPHNQRWPATPHEQARPAAPHDQPWTAAPHDQRWPAAPDDQRWPATPHDQPWTAAPDDQRWPATPHDQPWSTATEPSLVPYAQDPGWGSRRPGPATATPPLPLDPTAPNPYGPHPSGPQDFGHSGGPRDPRDRARARRKRRWLTAAAVLAAVLLGSIAIIMTRHPGVTAGHALRPTPPASRKAEAGAAGQAGRGATARHRITTAMIFPHAQVVADGIKFGRVTAVLNEECTLTARGAFASALTSAGCRRVARATFVDHAKRYAVTAGVAELSSAAAASQANQRLDFGRDVWFTGLDGPAHSGAAAVSRSVGLGYDFVYGRYIVYSLATYSSGQDPSGHAGAVRKLKDLAKSFAVMSRQSLSTHQN